MLGQLVVCCSTYVRGLGSSGVRIVAPTISLGAHCCRWISHPVTDVASVDSGGDNGVEAAAAGAGADGSGDSDDIVPSTGWTQCGPLEESPPHLPKADVFVNLALHGLA